MFLHLLSKTKDCDVIEDAAIVAEVLNDLLHTSPRLFRFHGSRRNVVVANLKRKQPIAKWKVYRDGDICNSVPMRAVGGRDNVPGGEEGDDLDLCVSYRIFVMLRTELRTFGFLMGVGLWDHSGDDVAAVPAVDQGSPTKWLRVDRPPISLQKTHLQRRIWLPMHTTGHLPRPLIAASLVPSNNPDSFQTSSNLSPDSATHLD